MKQLKKVLSLLLICAIFGATIPVQAQSEERKQTAEIESNKKKAAKNSSKKRKKPLKRKKNNWQKRK